MKVLGLLGAEISFLGPPKTQKIDFLQKLELHDLAEHCWGLSQCPVTNSHRPFLWRIIKIKIKNLLQEWCDIKFMSLSLGKI